VQSPAINDGAYQAVQQKGVVGANKAAVGGIVHQFTNFDTLEDCGKTTTAWIALLPGPEFEAGAGLEVLEEAGAATTKCKDGVNCFIAGTPVWMADGSLKPIEQIQSGDWVLSRDPLTGTNHASQVYQAISHLPGYVVRVAVIDQSTGQTETLSASPDHPFFTTNGLVPAHSLTAGSWLIGRSGSTLNVTSVDIQEQEHQVPVYNFVVPGDDTYFVGTVGDGAWVHNTGPYTLPAGESVRKLLYPTRVRKATMQRLEAAARDANGDIRCQSCNKTLQVGEGTPEHSPALVDTHNTLGYDTDQPTRNNLFNSTATELHCIDCQKAQGGRMTTRYRTDTGPNFRPRPSRRR
jgi:hypothetical protein